MARRYTTIHNKAGDRLDLEFEKADGDMLYGISRRWCLLGTTETAVFLASCDEDHPGAIKLQGYDPMFPLNDVPRLQFSGGRVRRAALIKGRTREASIVSLQYVHDVAIVIVGDALMVPA